LTQTAAFTVLPRERYRERGETAEVLVFAVTGA
jgi:hypothetical protein